MEKRELLKKIIDNMEFGLNITHCPAYIERETRARVRKKIGFYMNRRICACILEFYFNDEVQRKCMEAMKNFTFYKKKDVYRPLYLVIGQNITQKLKTIMKKGGENKISHFFQGLMHIIANDLVEFSLLDEMYVEFEKISLKETGDEYIRKNNKHNS